MRVNYLGFNPFRYNYLNICFVSIIAFSLGWTKLGLITVLSHFRLNQLIFVNAVKYS